MFELISNLKELKDFTISKVFIVTSILLILLGLTKLLFSNEYDEFLIAVSYLSEKIYFEEWSSVIIMLQLLTELLVVVSLISYVVVGMSITYFSNRNDEYKNTRVTLLNVTGKTFLLSMVGAFNILGYCTLLNGPKILTPISVGVYATLMLLIAGYVYMFFYKNK